MAASCATSSRRRPATRPVSHPPVGRRCSEGRDPSQERLSQEEPSLSSELPGRHPEPRRKERPLQITRNSLDTNRGPSDWFTGAVFVDAVAAPSEDSRVGAACVHFEVVAWGTHVSGDEYAQAPSITEGEN